MGCTGLEARSATTAHLSPAKVQLALWIQSVQLGECYEAEQSFEAKDFKFTEGSGNTRERKTFDRRLGNVERATLLHMKPRE